MLGHSYDADTIRSRAREVSDSALSKVCERTQSFRTTLVVGAFEVVDGHVFNSALVIEDGRIAGRYSKVYPNEPGVTAGSEFPTFVRSGIRFGMNICNDANHSDAAERIAGQKAALMRFMQRSCIPSGLEQVGQRRPLPPWTLFKPLVKCRDPARFVPVSMDQ